MHKVYSGNLNPAHIRGAALGKLYRFQSHEMEVSELMDNSVESIFVTGSSPEEILPDDALSVIAFTPQAITDWTTDDDLHTFIFKMLAGTGDEDQAELRLEWAKELGLYWADLFQRGAQSSTPAPGAKTQEVETPDFERDPMFGKAVKAYVAWEEAIENILAEAGYFSLSHTLETRSDLACSLKLAGDLFYRQSMQVLRGFIESVLLPIYLCKRPELFNLWKTNDYRAPSVRGEKGILSSLTKSGIISPEMSTTISEAYGLLNGYIHGSEEHLNNAGLDRGAWEGHVFQQARFEAWVRVFTSLIEVSLPLIKINLSQWATAKADRELFCLVCHGADVIPLRHKLDPAMTQYACKQCTHTFWRDDENRQYVHTTVEFPSDG